MGIMKMKKIFLFIVLLLSVTSIWSQRNQLIAYIDMEYILENVPEYLQAQNTLDSKVAKWRKKLDDQARHIEVLKTDLANEKAILTKELIEEKEEEITLKQQELRRLESLYFGPKGDMFLVRKQLVKPIQDQVYNAIQSIAARKKYDFVFEKSSDLIMLYPIKNTRLANKKKEDRKKRAEASKKPNQNLSAKQKENLAKKEEAETKKKDALAKKQADKEAKKKAIAEKRAALIKQREQKRKLLREKKEALRKKKEEEKKKKEENQGDN